MNGKPGFYDVIVVGAGAAGLMAASMLSEKLKVLILEGRDRTGGRIFTSIPDGFSQQVEAGAEFVHGNLALTKQVLNKAGAHIYISEGTIWRSEAGRLVQQSDYIKNDEAITAKLKRLKKNITLYEFLETGFGEDESDLKHALWQYAEGYDAADVQKASALAFKEEWMYEEEEQYKIKETYQPLVDHLQQVCITNGCTIHCNERVKTIEWKKDAVTISTHHNKKYRAGKVVITVPLPMLQQPSGEAGISFFPQLPQVANAANEIGFGGVIKIVAQCTHRFWEQPAHGGAKEMLFAFSDEKIPTWWTQHPVETPVLCGWCAGTKAAMMQHLDDEAILAEAKSSVINLFQLSTEQLDKYVNAWYVVNWMKDPFSCGAYSYNMLNSANARELLSKPVEDTLYFAGEAYTTNSYATVDAALQSAQITANKILSHKI